ncbi:hypothetical protein B0O99DRAFT_694292 [Bisporella sp. PMI_857]|nr:hypothetical protein B0O99DRAFT_694292 [Bisporella sp. PMI_857]
MSGSLKWVEYVHYGFGIAVMLLTLLRFYVRYITKTVGVDDWFILFSACLILGSCILVGLMFRQAGIGVHASNPSDNQVSSFGQILLSFQILYYFAIGSVHISTIALARRIRKFTLEPTVTYADFLFLTSQTLKSLVSLWNWDCYYIFGGYIIIYTVIASIATRYLCLPTNAISSTLGDDRCNTLNWVTVGLQSSTYLFLVLIPLQPIWKLKVGTGKKMRIVVAYLLGLLNIVMVILRGRWTHIAFTSPDFRWHLALVVFFTGIEEVMAHFCATLPVLLRVIEEATARSCATLLVVAMWPWKKFTGSFNTHQSYQPENSGPFQQL